MDVTSTAMVVGMVGGMGGLMVLVMVALHRKAPDVTSSSPLENRGSILVTFGAKIITGLLRMGVPLGPMTLLTVRGRKTGQLRTAPVDVYEHNGQRIMVSTHGGAGANWVSNLRAARQGSLLRGHHRETFTAVELDGEVAGPLLKAALAPRLASPIRGFMLRRTLGITSGSPLEDFIDVARNHPVFALNPARESSAIA